MLKNINYNVINRAKVMWSTLFIPLAAPILLLLMGIQGAAFDFESVISGIFLSLLFGAIFWIPSILGALLIEFLMIRENATEKHVAGALFLEGLIAFILIFWLVFDFGTYQPIWISVSLVLSITLPQCFRWWYLKGKNRMLMSASPKLDDSVIDQFSDL